MCARNPPPRSAGEGDADASTRGGRLLFNDMHCFDTKTSTWLSVPEAVHAPVAAAAGAADKRGVAEAGGASVGRRPPETASRKKAAATQPSVRRGHSAALHTVGFEPLIVIFGGMGYDPDRGKDVVLSDAWIYNVRAHTWTLVEAAGMVHVCGSC